MLDIYIRYNILSYTDYIGNSYYCYLNLIETVGDPNFKPLLLINCRELGSHISGV